MNYLSPLMTPPLDLHPQQRRRLRLAHVKKEASIYRLLGFFCELTDSFKNIEKGEKVEMLGVVYFDQQTGSLHAICWSK